MLSSSWLALSDFDSVLSWLSFIYSMSQGMTPKCFITIVRAILSGRTEVPLAKVKTNIIHNKHAKQSCSNPKNPPIAKLYAYHNLCIPTMAMTQPPSTLCWPRVDGGCYVSLCYLSPFTSKWREKYVYKHTGGAATVVSTDTIPDWLPSHLLTSKSVDEVPSVAGSITAKEQSWLTMYYPSHVSFIITNLLFLHS